MISYSARESIGNRLQLSITITNEPNAGNYHFSLQDSHQISLTRTRGYQQGEPSPEQLLTSSAIESGMFDLPPCLAASEEVIRPKSAFRSFTSSQKTGFPAFFAHAFFNSRRMLFPVVHKIRDQIM